MSSPAEDGPVVDGIRPPEVALRTITLVRWGIVAWAVALVAVLVVPALRTGERSWWVWVPDFS